MKIILIVILYIFYTHLSLQNDAIQFQYTSVEQCNNNGYFFHKRCYCFAQYQGKLCQEKKIHGYYSTREQCGLMINRLDNLLNINSKHRGLDDDEFPRLSGDSIGDSEYWQKNHGARWITMHNITKDFKIFGNTISPSQIHQGDLGNCYFLAALATFAYIRDGQMIKDMFVTKVDNKNHIYVTRWQIGGKTRFVAVDDWVPRKRYHKDKTFFSQVTNENVFWPIILEKSWAKIYGNYLITDTGLPSEFYEAIFQAKGLAIQHNKLNPEKLFQILQELLQEGFPVTTENVIYSQEQELKDKNNLRKSFGHAYAVLDAYEVENEKGFKQNLLKVFNPWQKEQWIENPWGNAGEMWTSKMRQKYNVEKSNGIFHLTPNDYFKQFTISRYSILKENYDIVSQDIPFKKGQTLYKIEFQVKSHPKQQFINVQLSKFSNRFIKSYNCKPFYEYENNSLKVTNPNNNQINDERNLKQIQIDDPLDGYYQVEIKLIQKTPFPNYFTISIYGYSGQINFLKKEDYLDQIQEKKCKNGCSGNGKCNTFVGRCICYHGYSGNDCSIKNEMKCLNDCNGNGKCENGICQCNQGFYGEECEPCQDKYYNCDHLEKSGQCKINSKNLKFMYEHCQKTCGEKGYKNFECFKKAKKNNEQK